MSLTALVTTSTRVCEYQLYTMVPRYINAVVLVDFAEFFCIMIRSRNLNPKEEQDFLVNYNGSLSFCCDVTPY